MTNPPSSHFPDHDPVPQSPPQEGYQQPGYQQPGYQQQPGYPAPGYPPRPSFNPATAKTSTKGGKVLTTIGALFAILAIVAAVLSTISFANLERDLVAVSDQVTNGTEVVGEETLLVAGANTTYTIFPQNSYRTDGTTTTWQSLNAASMRARISVFNTETGAEVAVTPVSSTGFISKLANSMLQPVGEFTTTEAGGYSIVVYPEPTADETLTVISSKLTSTLWDTVTKGFIWGGIATIAGFIATVFLIWGIILWVIRSSRRKKLAQFQAQYPASAY